MRYFLTIFLLTLISVVFLSCERQDSEDEKIIDYFTYGKRFDFREISMKTGTGDWENIDNGNVFSWLGGEASLSNQLKIPQGDATYDDRANLRADFIYNLPKDSVFSYSIRSDSLYFFDESMENFRTDLKGELIFSPDTIIILHNTGVSPTISIKYSFEKK